jgi:hypothetical protein
MQGTKKLHASRSSSKISGAIIHLKLSNHRCVAYVIIPCSSVLMT